MKNKKKENTVESNFLASLLFLLLSLGVSLTVFLKYRPTRSFNYKLELTLAEKKAASAAKLSQPAHLATKALDSKPRSSESLTHPMHYEPEVHGTVTPQKATLMSSDSKELIQKALHLVNEDKPDEARRLLEKVLGEDPNNEEALTQLALIHILDFKDESAAQPLLEKALKINPENKTALAELVEIYADREDGTGVKLLQNIYEKNADNSNLALGIGQVLIESNPKAAIPYLEKGGDRALTDLGEAYSLSGDHVKALETHQHQEDVLNNKIQAGEGGEYAKEELKRVKINIVVDFKAQGREEQARQKLAELRPEIGNDAEDLALFESLGMAPPGAPKLQSKTPSDS